MLFLEEISIVEIGNRQSSTNPHYIHKTVVKPEFTDRTKYYILGLCVANDAFIPENAVIGEYTGKIVTKQDKKSLYTFEMAEGTYVDAQDTGNTIRFVNNRCVNTNAFFLTVITAGGQKSIFLKAERDIHAGEFISASYGESYEIHNCLCDDCYFEDKKPKAK